MINITCQKITHTFSVPGVGAKLSWAKDVIADVSTIRDIFGGEKVKELQAQGWFRGQSEDIGLVMSTDGGVLFKRTSISVWPIWAVIANLPPTIR